MKLTKAEIKWLELLAQVARLGSKSEEHDFIIVRCQMVIEKLKK